MEVSELRERIKTMDNLPPSADRHTWLRRRIEIRKDIHLKDPREFLGWSTVQECMFVGNAPYTDYEFHFLTEGNDRDRWIEAIEDPGFGAPEPYENDLVNTTGNIIHQAYIMKLFEMGSMAKLDVIDSIVEFGGGYGTMAGIARKLGFTGEYIIYDFPEFSALQDYYLSNIGVEASCVTEFPCCHYDMLIALWSISESPIEIRDEFMSGLDYPALVLATYVAHWDGVNNWRWFTELGENYDSVIDEPLYHMSETSSRIFVADDL